MKPRGITRTQQCETFLQGKREEVLAYVRETWLEFLFGKPICRALNYTHVSGLPNEWKSKHIRNEAARHQMRKAYALGYIRWGLAVLEASETFGMSVTNTAIKRLYPADNGDPTIGEILPDGQFGKLPLGEGADYVWALS